jgi:hypothetical protein
MEIIEELRGLRSVPNAILIKKRVLYRVVFDLEPVPATKSHLPIINVYHVMLK